MLEKETAVLHKSNPTRSDYVGACRFFNNDQVTDRGISQAFAEQTGEAAAGKKVIAIHDTTSVNFAAHSGYLDAEDEHLGPVGPEGGQGFFIHPTIVLDEASGVLLGASDIYIWNRKENAPDKHERQYQEQPIVEKESNRWIERCLASKKVLNQATSILFVADREADIYEEFYGVPDAKSHVLIRCKANRLLHGGGKLYETVAAQPVAGELSVDIREAKKRKERKATLTIKYCKVRIARPKNHAHKKDLPEFIELYGLEVKEKSATVPKGEKPISWILLSDKEITNLTQALYFIKCYGLRWQIELVFGTLKSGGLELEESELESGRALKIMAVMSFITALRVNQLRLNRSNTSLSATIIFTSAQIALLHLLVKKLEGKTQIQKNPHPAETMAWAIWVIARLGGWKGYSKSESPPGNKTMYWGWNDFNKIYQGWELNNNLK